MLKRSYIKCESAALFLEDGIEASRNGFCFLRLVLACSNLHNDIGVGEVHGAIKVGQTFAGEDLDLQLPLTSDILLQAFEVYRCHCVGTCLVGGLCVNEGMRVWAG